MGMPRFPELLGLNQQMQQRQAQIFNDALSGQIRTIQSSRTIQYGDVQGLWELYMINSGLEVIQDFEFGVLKVRFKGFKEYVRFDQEVTLRQILIKIGKMQLNYIGDQDE